MLPIRSRPAIAATFPAPIDSLATLTDLRSRSNGVAGKAPSSAQTGGRSDRFAVAAALTTRFEPLVAIRPG